MLCLLAANGNVEKIVGGRNATIEEFPWQVSLFNASSGNHFCGGAIIDRYTILTAGHCIRPNRPVAVRLGTTYHADGGFVIRNLRRIVVHPDYVRDTDENDIALLILRNPLRYSRRVQPVALPEFQYDLAANALVQVSGWGVRGIWNERRYTASLQAVEVPVIEQDDCLEAYRDFPRNVTNYMFCAGLLGVGGKDSCQVGSRMALDFFL